MTIEEKVQELLIASLPAYGWPPTVLVPADRVKPLGAWQNLDRPYVVHFPIAVETTYSHEQRERLNGWPYQVSCFGDSYSESRGVAAAVAGILSGNHDGCQFFVRSQTTVFDPEVNVHHIVVDFEVYETL